MRTSERGVAVVLALFLSAVPAVLPPAAGVASAAASDGQTRLDPAFAGGLISGSLTAGRDVIVDVVVQPDGKIVAAGLLDGSLLVLRFTARGGLDGSFGNGGAFVLDTAGDDGARAVALGPQGTILVAGWSGGGPAVLRLTPGGDLDPAFGGGVVRPSPAGRVEAMTVLGDGAVLVGLAGGSPTLVARLRPDGELDPAFGDGGTIPSTVFGDAGDGVAALVAYPDGSFVVGGSGWSPSYTGAPLAVLLLARFTAGGALDPSFGQGGTVATELHTTHVARSASLGALALQPDGRILATGAASQPAVPVPPPWPEAPPPAGLRVAADHHLALLRYLPDGTLDTSLGATGKVVTPVRVAPDPSLAAVTVLTADDSSGGADVAVDSSGRIVVAGSAHGPDARPALFRFTASGLLDTTFGQGGAFFLDRARHGGARAVAVQRDGHLVVGGHLGGEVQEDVMVARVAPGSSAGLVRAWGWNGTGQLGDRTTTDRQAPTAVPGMSGVVSVSAGGYHTLALRGDGTVWAWGWNGTGQLGDGTTLDRHAPVRVAGLDGVVAVAAGTFHSLAVRGDGTVWAWGWNAVGQLGDGTTASRLAPVRVEGLGDVVSVSAGSYHSAAVRDDATAWTWGWNGTGQLGDGTTTDRLHPVRVARVDMVHGLATIAAGGLHTQAQSTFVDSLAWGWNGYGIVGTPAGGSVPLPSGRVIGTLAAAAGTYHGLLLTWRGEVLAGGFNSAGQLGDGGTVAKRLGAPVQGLAGVNGVAAGGFHSLAVTGDRRLHAWGWNGVGQLGTGGTADRHVPAPVPGLANVVAVSGGLAHTVAVVA
ncbi:MAG: hypothetical protein ACLGI2_14920 [Acidimicrobiia bacterium]